MTQYNNQSTEYCADLGYVFYQSYESCFATRISNKALDIDKSLVFENHEFPVPSNYDEVLTTLYGDYMTLPDVEDRKIHMIEDL